MRKGRAAAVLHDTERQGALESERLTRQELTWLLTQEARGAAENLRKGVATLATAEIHGQTIPAPAGLELELDALDEAMKALASLHAGTSPRGRRGRIDLAALVCDASPDARVAIEPGGGTEVFGDESELRRMLQVLVGSMLPSGATGELGAPEISIRRDGSNVRVSVVLGPDSSGPAGTERAWLSRMAIRYGGRLELEGATESLLLPADGAAEARELQSLRRELEAAQRQGEAYARELAAVFAQGSVPSPSPPPADTGLSVMVGLAATLLPQVRASIQAASSGDWAADLGMIATCPLQDPWKDHDWAELVLTVSAELGARAARRSVGVRLHAPDVVIARTRLGPARVLVQTLLADAIAATPSGGTVTVSVEPWLMTVEDQGPAFRAASWTSAGSGPADGATPDRPTTVALFCAGVLAQHLSAELASLDAPHGKVVVRFPHP